MQLPETPSFIDQSPDTAISKIVSRMVLFTDSDEAYCSGTAVAICQNFHITARHVIEDFARLHGSLDGSITSVNATLWLIHIYPGPIYAIWEADQVWTSPHTDIAFIHTRPCNDISGTHESGSIVLDLAFPQIGERVFGFGYRASQGGFRRNPDGTRHLDVSDIPTITTGEIIEVFPERRDNSRLNFPCFRINARFDGGMSGGPLFNDRGWVCGLICSSLPPEDGHGEHISYGVALWPAMATLIDYPGPSLGKGDRLHPDF